MLSQLLTNMYNQRNINVLMVVKKKMTFFLKHLK